MRLGTYLLQSKVKKSLTTGLVETGPTKAHYWTALAVAVVSPMCVTYLLQEMLSLTSVFTNEPPCAPCRQLRTVGCQLAGGWFNPILLCLVGTNYVVKTEGVISPYKKGQLLSWVGHLLKRNRNLIYGTLVAQTFLAAAVNYGQEHQWYNLNLELLERIEQDNSRKK